MSDHEGDGDGAGGGAVGGQKDPAGPPSTEVTQNLPEFIKTLTIAQQAELLQLLQGTKPKVKPEDQLVSQNANDQRGDRRDRNAGNNAVNLEVDRNEGVPRVLEENKIPRLPNFSGDSSKGQTVFRVWEFEVTNLRTLFGEREVMRAIHRSVTGTAAQVLMRLGNDATLDQVLAKFKLVFGTVVTNEQLLSDFYSAQQKSSESVAEWACRLEDLLCHPQLDDITAEKRNSMLKAKFSQGLVLDNVKHALRHRMTDGTYDEILVLARQAEEEHRVKGKVVSKAQTVEADPMQKKLDDILKDLKSLSTKVNQLESKIDRKPQGNSKPSQSGTSGSQPTSTSETSTFPSRNFICNYCKKPGHVKRNCRKLLNASSSAARSDP